MVLRSSVAVLWCYPLRVSQQSCGAAEVAPAWRLLRAALLPVRSVAARGWFAAGALLRGGDDSTRGCESSPGAALRWLQHSSDSAPGRRNC